MSRPEGSVFEFNPNTYRPDQLPPHVGAVYELETNPGRFFEDPFDLDNLKFYSSADAGLLIRELEGRDAENCRSGKQPLIVAMIGTGGTIASKLENGVRIPKLDPNTLLGELPASKRERFTVSSIQLPRLVDSSVMPPDVIADTVLLMAATYNRMSPELRENFGGFLIAHGTDTLAQSAALARIMLGPQVPFNYGWVGSQKGLDEENNDVAPNISGALTSLEIAKRDLEPTDEKIHFVYMNGSPGAAMNSLGVVKVSDSQVQAFESPIHAPIVDMANFAIAGLRRRKLHYSSFEQFRPLIVRGDIRVREIYAQQGVDPRWDRDAIRAAGYLAGVSVITYGSFTFHPANFAGIMEAANEKDIPVFVSNPFLQGSVSHKYEQAKKIIEMGGIPVQMMPSALRAKIHVGRAMFADFHRFTDFVMEDYVGEMPDGAPNLPLETAFNTRVKRYENHPSE